MPPELQPYTIKIPPPPEGYEVEQEMRIPRSGDYVLRQMCIIPSWALVNDEGTIVLFIVASKPRDEYAEHYEALKLPDGWAWRNVNNKVLWCEQDCTFEERSLRRILNGKAYMPGSEELKRAEAQKGQA